MWQKKNNKNEHMKKIIIPFIALFTCGLSAIAQDDLLGELEAEDSAIVKENITAATFKATRVINMQSVEMTGLHNMQFMIIHHFGALWDSDEGAGNFGRLFGMNAGFANTYMSFDYTPIKWMNLGVAFAGNSSLEGTAKFKLMRQQTGKKNYPVSIAWVSNFNVNVSSKVESPNNFDWNRFSYLNQLLIARKFNEKLSLQFNPSWVHYNIVPYGYNTSNDIFSLGFGGRFKLSNKEAITFEYSRQLNMYKDITDKTGEIINYSPNLISLGFDWDTGGHVFQFFFSNSYYSSNIFQLSTNTKKDNFGQWCMGFNLNRSYAMKKSVQTH
jgi:hypothetical protein